MTTNQEQNAERLNSALEAGGACNESDLKPFCEVAEALKREASGGESKLDPAVALAQRANLISMAEKSSAKERPSFEPNGEPVVMPTPATKGPAPRIIPWYAWVGGTAAALAALTLLIVVYPRPTTGPLFEQAAQAPRALARYVIPEAHAGDAFSLVSEKQDAAGTDVTSGFIVTSTLPVTAKDIEQHFELVPPVSAAEPAPVALAVNVKTTGVNKFLITPDKPLEPGKVYKLKLTAAIQKEDGTVINRDFSWAVQTKNIFRVISSVPGPDTSSVPVNTAIEFTMSMTGWENATSSFTIEPKVDGRFETHGRSLAFVPNKPLAYGQIYTATLKKGFKVAGSDSVLPSDAVIKFETESYAAVVPEVRKISIYPSRDIVFAAPNKEISVPTWYFEADGIQDISVTAYKLNANEAGEFLLAVKKIPEFAVATKNRGDVYTKYAKNKAAEITASVTEENYQLSLIIPHGLPSGHYLMKIEPKNGIATWFYLECTKVATYAIADKLNTVLWAVNTETDRPLSDLPVKIKDTATKTDALGVVKFITPEEAVSTSTDSAAVIQVGEGDLETVVRLEHGVSWWDYYGYSRNNPFDDRVFYLYVDRPIYHLSDRAFAYGVAQERKTSKASTGLTVELTRNGIFDYFVPGKDKVFRTATVTPDDSGFFKASLDWSNLAPGFYVISLKKDGSPLSSQTVELRDFQKPSYSLEVTADKRAVYAGDTVNVELKAAFYNGAPMPNLPVKFNAYANYGSAAASVDTTLTTDEGGMATYAVLTKKSSCNPYAVNAYCPSYETVNMDVHPAEGEEGWIQGSDSITVWNSHASLEAATEIENKTATIKFTARQVDLSRAQNQDTWNVLGEALRGKPITGKIIETRWDRVESGNYYDSIDKKVYPSYRYVRKDREVSSINLTTDAAGLATMKFEMTNGQEVSYRAIATIKDDQGGEDHAVTYFAPGWYRRSENENAGVSLEPNKADLEKGAYHLGDKVSVSFRKSEELMPATAEPTYLFLQATLGIRAVEVSNKPTYAFDYTADLVPNVKVYGVAYRNGGFIERTFNAYFDSQDRKLKLTVTPDQTSYAPGAKAKFHVEAKTADGKPAAKARIVLNVVDEAVYATTYMTVNEDPLISLYGSVSDGIILHELSHETMPAGFGGAERGGGGGGEMVRRNFKDTAAFETVTVSDKGEADVEISLPDNLTRWRVTTVAITPDRFGGNSRQSVAVTKPVFVEAVLPSPLLTSDKPIMKLRAYGTGLKTGEPVTFSIDAPTLSLSMDNIQARAGSSTFVGLNLLTPGTHKLVIRVKAQNGSDAFEKTINVVTSNFLRDEMVETELGPGVKLPDVGSSREVTVSFVPKTRAQFLDDLHSLTYAWRDRLESQLAGKLARSMLEKYFDEKFESPSQPLLRYQKQNGGLAILPYSSEDVELTSKVATIAPQEFDKNLMMGYLWGVAENSNLTREQGLRALSGLAALGEPVLLQLQSLSALEDLNWREQLALIRGLQAAGDTESAKRVYEKLMAKSQENDGLMQLRVDEKEMKYNLEATAEAAGMAWILGDPKAAKMHAWLTKNWDQDAFTVLDRIAYLSLAVPAASGKDVSLSYTVGGEEESLELENGWSESVILTADEAKKFLVTKVDGPAVAVFSRAVTSMPKNNPDLSLKRTYERADGSNLENLREGDIVTVKLSATMAETAQNGCYTVKDFVPAGLSPTLNVYFDPYNAPANNWYPTEIDGNRVSFVLCNFYSNRKPWSENIAYRVRVMARGTYTAEPAVLQSEEAPSVAALSSKPEEKVTITIK